MDNQIISASYSIFTNKSAYALLLGSGISRTSGIPTGWDITLQLINQIATLEKQISISNLEQWYKDRFDEEADYSDILQKLTNTQEERLNLLRPFLEPNDEELEEGLKQPTIAHRQIAQLVRGGYIKVIVTTNFDRLLENALKDVGVEPTVISNPEHLENSIPLVHSKITVIKINGDYLDTTFLNTKSELENYDTRLSNNLRFIFENYGLITCGWSAKWDIALVNVLKAASKFRYGSYFCYITKPDEELESLSINRQGNLIQIKDADSFFEELTENIEALEKNNAQHPLTPQLVIQRLKKYVVKDEHLIDLHDLCQSVFEDFEKRVKAIRLQNPPTNDLILKVRSSFLFESDMLSIVVAHLSFYGNSNHYNILYTLIRQASLTSEQTNVSSYEVWMKISYLPTLILRYICGISLVYHKNFNVINHIHKQGFLIKRAKGCHSPTFVVTRLQNHDYYPLPG